MFKVAGGGNIAYVFTALRRTSTARSDNEYSKCGCAGSCTGSLGETALSEASSRREGRPTRLPVTSAFASPILQKCRVLEVRLEIKTFQLGGRRTRIVSTRATSTNSVRPAPVWCSYCRIIVTMLYQACT